MEQSQQQINVGRDWNQAPNGSIQIENSGDSKNKLLWWILGIIGSVAATVIGARLLNLFNL